MHAEIIIPKWAKYIISDFTNYERNAKKLDSKTDKIEYTLPDDVYFTYGFLDENKKLGSDPNNPNKADTPNYPELSAIIGPEYKQNEYYNPSSKALGRVFRQSIKSKYLKQNKRIIIYTPEGYEDFELPVIYIHDGVAYYRIAQLAAVLEQLLANNLVNPAHLVFIEPKNRFLEYNYSQNYQEFIVKELLPFIDNGLQTTNQRMSMGASLGGLVSAILVLEYPALFQTVISQSGAFWGGPNQPNLYEATESWVLDKVKQTNKPLSRWYTEVGTLEWFYEINLQISEALKDNDFESQFAVRNIGHNWVNWRNGLSDALIFALHKEQHNNI